MARKVVTYTEQGSGRDQGKAFVLTEMPSSQAEKWAIRAFLALAQAGVEIPDSIAASGFAGLFQIGTEALAKIPYQTAEPLMDEMFNCIQFMPDRSKPNIVRPLIEDDIEEIATRIKLRAATLKLHTGFLSAGDTSTSGQPSA